MLSFAQTEPGTLGYGPWCALPPCHQVKCNAYLLSPCPPDASKSIICPGNGVNMFYDLIESSIVEPESLARVYNFCDSQDKLGHYMPTPAVYVALT